MLAVGPVIMGQGPLCHQSNRPPLPLHLEMLPPLLSPRRQQSPFKSSVIFSLLYTSDNSTSGRLLRSNPLLYFTSLFFHAQRFIDKRLLDPLGIKEVRKRCGGRARTPEMKKASRKSGEQNRQTDTRIVGFDTWINKKNVD